jgi:hypothetical protein
VLPSLEVESAIPTLSTPSAIPTLGSSTAGFYQTLAEDYVTLREATKTHGSLIGRVAIHKAGGTRYVKKSDLATLGKNSRGSRAKQAAKSDGPGERIAEEVANATKQRQQAFAQRQRKVDEHNQRRSRDYEPRNY